MSPQVDCQFSQHSMYNKEIQSLIEIDKISCPATWIETELTAGPNVLTKVCWPEKRRDRGGPVGLQLQTIKD